MSYYGNSTLLILLLVVGTEPGPRQVLLIIFNMPIKGINTILKYIKKKEIIQCCHIEQIDKKKKMLSDIFITVFRDLTQVYVYNEGKGYT